MFDSVGHLVNVYKGNDGFEKMIYRLDAYSKGIYVAKLTIKNKTKRVKIVI